MIEHMIFEQAAEWTHARIFPALAVSVHELRQAFEALSAVARDAGSTFLMPDLFPGVELDVMYVHDAEGMGDGKAATQNSGNHVIPGLSAQALNAIGIAVVREMQATDSDMVRYRVGGAEIIVSRPGVRALVLQATGTTLLTKQ